MNSCDRSQNMDSNGHLSTQACALFEVSKHIHTHTHIVLLVKLLTNFSTFIVYKYYPLVVKSNIDISFSRFLINLFLDANLACVLTF